MAFLLQPRLVHATTDARTKPNRGRSFMDVSPFPRFAAPSGTYDHFWWTRGRSKERESSGNSPKTGGLQSVSAATV
jgi:hypothetical protein